jgi:hypothetical protein
MHQQIRHPRERLLNYDAHLGGKHVGLPHGDLRAANGIAAGPEGKLWFAEANAEEIENAPICALGLSASFSGGTLATNFDLGVAGPARWIILAQDTVLQTQSTPAAAPPDAFTFRLGTILE